MKKCFSSFDATQYHTLAYKQHKFISHSSGDWKSKVKVPEDLMSGEDSLPGLYHLFAVPSHDRKSKGALSQLL